MKDIKNAFQVFLEKTLVSLVAVILISPFGLLPHNAEAESGKTILCVKRKSQLSGVVYFRSSSKCLPGEKKINSIKGDQGPVGATGPAAPLTVDPVHANGTLITTNSIVKFNTVNFTYGNASYDTNTGIMTFTEAGDYHFIWQAAVDGLGDLPTGYDPQITPPYASFAISSSQNDLERATLPTHLGSLNGTAILRITSVPATVSLVNTSPWSVNLAGAHTPKATMNVIRLYAEFSPVILNLELH